MDASAADTCSGIAEQKSLPISMKRMMGLETAVGILGGTDQLAAALGITARAVRYKLTADRGISDSDLSAAAEALDARAARIAAHAQKLRDEIAASGAVL